MNNRINQKTNVLSITNPELLKEWNYGKNEGDTPDVFSFGSHKKVWWKCSICGNEWQARIYTRTKGHGCPICAKKSVGRAIALGKTKVGINDLSTKRPELLKEWNFEKNEGIDPSNISFSSNKKVWWKCSICGNEWQASVNNRAKGSRCPSCMKYTQSSYSEQAVFYYIKREFGDAVNRFSPKWMNKMEIDIYIPSLNLGIEYDGEAFHKTKTDSDCRKAKLLKKHKIDLVRIREPKTGNINDNSFVIFTGTPTADLLFLEDSILAIFSFIEERYNIPINKEVNIRKDYKTIVSMFTHGKYVDSLGFNYPELINEWNYDRNTNLNPYAFSTGSRMKVWWKCSKCGYEWKAVIGTRCKGSGCPVCKGRIARKGVNDFLTMYPEIAKEWSSKNVDVLPNELLPNSAKKVWWKCSKCGHEWQARLNNRVSNRSGCPICSKKKQVDAFSLTIVGHSGSLVNTNPKLIEEWDFAKNKLICDPERITYGSHKKVWWKCSKCGHEWQAEIVSRTAGRGCPNCALENRHIKASQKNG